MLLKPEDERKRSHVAEITSGRVLFSTHRGTSANPFVSLSSLRRTKG